MASRTSKEDLRPGLHHRRQRVDDVGISQLSRSASIRSKPYPPKSRRCRGAVQGDKIVANCSTMASLSLRPNRPSALELEQRIVDDANGALGVGLARLERERERGHADAVGTVDDDAVLETDRVRMVESLRPPAR